MSVIEVPNIEEEELIQRACVFCNDRSSSDFWATPNDDRFKLALCCFKYLRWRISDQTKKAKTALKTERLKNPDPRQSRAFWKAFKAIDLAACRAIVSSYPWLREACLSKLYPATLEDT